MAIRLHWWQRLWVVVSALWFLGWLVGFPLYVRSKNLRDAEFVVQKLLNNPKPYEPGLAPEEQERLRPVFERLMRIMESFEKDNSRLAQEMRRASKELERERSELWDWGMKRLKEEEESSGQTTESEEYARRSQRIDEKEHQLSKKYSLMVEDEFIKESASFPNIYKRLLKSNWSGWGLYVLLGPLVAYAGVYGGILAVRWVMQGFRNAGS